jgi:hypothetical protein
MTAPSFAKQPSYVSDVQFSYTLSPDQTSNSILFDNFSVDILAGGPPVAIRSFSIGFPISDMTSGADLALDVRGALHLDAGATCTMVLRVLGETRVLDPLLDGERSGDFLKSVKLKMPAGRDDLRITLIIAVEQNGSKAVGQATLTVDSIDLAISSPTP